MKSQAKTVEQYIAELPDDRRETITKIRNLILKNIPEGYEEGMLYGMISYYIPLLKYPNTYNKQPLSIISLASQKQHISLYLMCVYGDKKREKILKNGFEKAGKKMNMGKSCLRFKKLEDVDLPTLEKIFAEITPKEFIEIYENARKR